MLRLTSLILIASLFTGCTSYHQGVSSYEEVYSADQPSTFEFTHFKYFGSRNVLIINEDRNIKRNLAELCLDFEMSCHKLKLDIESETASSQMDKVLEQIQSFKGETFLLVADHADVTSAIVAKYAKQKYNDEDFDKIFRTFKAENKEILLPLVK